MEQTTLEAGPHRELRGRRLSGPERLGAWFYTGPAGRLVSFSIDLGLSLAALGIWSTRRIWRRIRAPSHSSAA
jgi:hypothetical protein